MNNTSYRVGWFICNVVLQILFLYKGLHLPYNFGFWGFLPFLPFSFFLRDFILSAPGKKQDRKPQEQNWKDIGFCER